MDLLCAIGKFFNSVQIDASKKVGLLIFSVINSDESIRQSSFFSIGSSISVNLE